MGIRNYNKDHLKELAGAPASVLLETPDSVDDDGLRFWTQHPTRPCQVDLRAFRDGESKRPHPGGTWSGKFTGRPDLIREIAPVLREVVRYAVPNTSAQYVHYLRTWWRLLDDIEEKAGDVFVRVRSVIDLTAIHKQSAYDVGMERKVFSGFQSIVNAARRIKGLPPLYWRVPEGRDSKRRLPPQAHLDQIRHAIKHAWFAALHRWNLADELSAGREPLNTEEARLAENYSRFKAGVASAEHPRPTSHVLWGDLTFHAFNRRGLSIPDMLRGFYPDANDIRAAFHLCLASTGWNPAVLLDLRVGDDFLEPHPKDPTRYLMRGHKNRGNSEQVTEGLYKSQGSAGIVLERLIRQTEPLRAQLVLQLAELKNNEAELSKDGRPLPDKARLRIAELERGTKSPWLYVTSANDAINWLDSQNYRRSSLKKHKAGNYLDDIVAQLNATRPDNAHISSLNPSDFRDAFATYVYQLSGGMVLYVMKVLGHKSPQTTQLYLDNNVLNAKGEELYRTFSNSLWREIEFFGRADPTLIAKWTRDGSVSADERVRLHEYRGLMRSRIGVGCKSPTTPPRRLAPDFEVDGKKLCPVQRCTLCVENAVILPGSMPGLCKRLAELRHIQSHMSTVSFIDSSFKEEMENVELALLYFDALEVAQHFLDWERRISSGQHRVIEFDSPITA